MNELIKELAIQVQRTEMPGVLFAHPEFVEKFAELIIRECADVALQEEHDPSDCILGHFGLKR